MWKCENCGNECKDVLDACWSCETPKGGASFCPTCTRLFPAGETECRHCTTSPASGEQLIEPRKKKRTRDERLRSLQLVLRILAWLAVGFGAFRIYAILRTNTDAYGDLAFLPSRYSDYYSNLYNAAYSWVILMVLAELVGLIMAIEVNTRRSGDRQGDGS